MKQLILASGSASRKEILKRAGVKFKVDVSDYQEDMSLKLSPRRLAEHLSLGKAKLVAARHHNAVILACDSFAVFNGQILAKPHNRIRARQMLKVLSGQCHLFVTGFTLIDTDSGRVFTDSDVTKVYFRKLPSEDIEGYIGKEDVLNNAGAYRIQDLGAILIERIEGSYSNVVGMPITKIAKALKDFGINILSKD